MPVLAVMSVNLIPGGVECRGTLTLFPEVQPKKINEPTSKPMAGLRMNFRARDFISVCREKKCFPSIFETAAFPRWLSLPFLGDCRQGRADNGFPVSWAQ